MNCLAAILRMFVFTILSARMMVGTQLVTSRCLDRCLLHSVTRSISPSLSASFNSPKLRTSASIFPMTKKGMCVGICSKIQSAYD